MAKRPAVLFFCSAKMISPTPISAFVFIMEGKRNRLKRKPKVFSIPQPNIVSKGCAGSHSNVAQNAVPAGPFFESFDEDVIFVALESAAQKSKVAATNSTSPIQDKSCEQANKALKELVAVLEIIDQRKKLLAVNLPALPILKVKEACSGKGSSPDNHLPCTAVSDLLPLPKICSCFVHRRKRRQTQIKSALDKGSNICQDSIQEQCSSESDHLYSTVQDCSKHRGINNVQPNRKLGIPHLSEPSTVLSSSQCIGDARHKTKPLSSLHHRSLQRDIKRYTCTVSTQSLPKDPIAAGSSKMSFQSNISYKSMSHSDFVSKQNASSKLPPSAKPGLYSKFGSCHEDDDDFEISAGSNQTEPLLVNNHNQRGQKRLQSFSSDISVHKKGKNDFAGSMVFRVPESTASKGKLFSGSPSSSSTTDKTLPSYSGISIPKSSQSSFSAFIRTAVTSESKALGNTCIVNSWTSPQLKSSGNNQPAPKQVSKTDPALQKDFGYSASRFKPGKTMGETGVDSAKVTMLASFTYSEAKINGARTGEKTSSERLENCPMCQTLFSPELPQMDMDAHIAACLSLNDDDIIW